MTKFAFLALLPLSISAQSGAVTTPEDQIVTKIIHVHYVPAETIRELITAGPMSAAFSASANNGLKAIVLKGTVRNVTAAEETIKELDVPSPSESARDVELTVYVIGATAQPAQNPHSSGELEPVIRQLKAVFPYADYQVLDSMLIRTRENRHARTGGLLRNFPNPQVDFLNKYNIDCDLGQPVAGSSSRVIRLNSLSFSTGIAKSDVRVGLDTNLDLQDGQKVVVGKTNIDNGNSALFVVITGKFVQ